MPHTVPDENLLVFVLIGIGCVGFFYMIFKRFDYAFVAGTLVGVIISYYLLEFDQRGGGDNEF